MILIIYNIIKISLLNFFVKVFLRICVHFINETEVVYWGMLSVPWGIGASDPPATTSRHVSPRTTHHAEKENRKPTSRKKVPSYSTASHAARLGRGALPTRNGT
jgi:hypothetical protein